MKPPTPITDPVQYIYSVEERLQALEEAVNFLVKDVDKLLANRKLCDLCKVAIEKDEGK